MRLVSDLSKSRLLLHKMTFFESRSINASLNNCRNFTLSHANLTFQTDCLLQSVQTKQCKPNHAGQPTTILSAHDWRVVSDDDSCETLSDQTLKVSTWYRTLTETNGLNWVLMPLSVERHEKGWRHASSNQTVWLSGSSRLRSGSSGIKMLFGKWRGLILESKFGLSTTWNGPAFSSWRLGIGPVTKSEAYQ